MVLEFASVFVNSPGSVDDTLPFGGFKESGIGRDKGEAALHHCESPNPAPNQACKL